MPNRLINESSPYLLQHANNPVDWFPWGSEALQKAQRENKPILVSIGYSACHWCHVMEKESFENHETAALMNKYFVNIKIDREERPDLDHIYMDAVQAMTGSGGWPLNVFLTPEAKPFFGGTYFPPRRAFNRSSWQEVLLSVSNAFNEKRDEINLQSDSLIEYLLQSNSFGLQKPVDDSSIFSRQKIDEAYESLMKSADKEWGGFGRPPKFPQTFSIQFLLRYYHISGNKDALKQACLSLDKMIEGGIYDQIGGGFARYSTDGEWLIPHFEKMLYDNALLIFVLSEAYQLTRKERYEKVIEETIEFILKELMSIDGGFYSALDADSEGEEGKYYLWEYDDVKKLLGKDAEIFCHFFDIKEKGNLPAGEADWHGKSILRVKKSVELFATEKNIPADQLETVIREGKSILLSERNNRVRPALDNKIVLGWNALMNAACSKAFEATGEDDYRQLAISNMKFLLSNFESNAGHFLHTRKNNEVNNFAFLDDYAFLIQALLLLQEITGDTGWLFKARQITEYVIRNFSEKQSGFFFFTDIKQDDVIMRKKEVYDGATPSGNATMAYNIYQLSILFDIQEWRKRSEEMVTSLSNAGVRYPTSFGIWLNLFMEMICGTNEIVVIGRDSLHLGEKILAEYIPHKILEAAETGSEILPLLKEKPPTDPPLIYLCRAYSCLKPVSGVKELLQLLDKGNKN